VRDRQRFFAHDARGAVAHVRVDGFPALGAERFHRQDLAARLRFGDAALFFARVRIGAHQRAQVAQVEQLRFHIAGERAARLAGCVGQLAANIARPDLAFELVIGPGAAMAVDGGRQAPGRGKGRRFRQQDAGKFVQARHAAASQRQVDVQRGQLGRAGDRAFDGHAVRARKHLGLDGERGGLVLERQHGPGFAVARHRCAVVGAGLPNWQQCAAAYRRLAAIGL
jgi:hypothetical protein